MHFRTGARPPKGRRNMAGPRLRSSRRNSGDTLGEEELTTWNGITCLLLAARFKTRRRPHRGEPQDSRRWGRLISSVPKSSSSALHPTQRRRGRKGHREKPGENEGVDNRTVSSQVTNCSAILQLPAPPAQSQFTSSIFLSLCFPLRPWRPLRLCVGCRY